MSRLCCALATLTLALLSFSSAPAGAQDKPAAPPAGGAAPAQKWVAACEADVQKHCKDVQGAGGDVRPCLKSHEKELSESCADIFLRPYRVMELCQGDIDKLCKAQANTPTVGRCLVENKDKLSDKCRSALVAGSKAHIKEKKAEEAEAKAEAAPEAKPAKATSKKKKK